MPPALAGFDAEYWNFIKGDNQFDGDQLQRLGEAVEAFAAWIYENSFHAHRALLEGQAELIAVNAAFHDHQDFSRL